VVRSRTTQSSSGSGENPLSVVAGEVAALAVWDLIKATAVMLWWAVLYPMLSVPVLGCAAMWRLLGWPVATAVAVVSAVGLAGWRVCCPRSWHRWVSGRIWKRWRRWRIYRRPWATTCALHGLTATLDDHVLIPALRSVRIGEVTDTITVRMLRGQSVEDWEHQSDALTHAFGARSVQVRAERPGQLILQVHHRDSLSTPIPVPPPGEPVDLAAVPIGHTDTGQAWRVRILGRHLLVAGATGSGKGGVIWSILSGLAPAIHTGVVSVRVIDPKGGMELGAGQPLFARFAYDTGEQMLTVLREVVDTMSARADRLRGHTRLHTPTVAEPLILLIIDEAASLTAYVTDRKVKAEVEQLLGLLLSQGRAIGVSVIAAVQDPSKEVVALRQLFPTRIGLRMSEPTQVAMVLGQSARDRGARCDQISDALPGVGYVAEDGTAALTRVRAFEVNDTNIDDLAARYRAPTGGHIDQQPAGTAEQSPDTA